MAPLKEKPRLLLLDGNALVHRAHHALPPLTITKTGEVISAVFGFASMLLKAINELKPTYMAVAFDRPEPTFRHREYQDYKAQRPPIAQELIPQFGKVRELLAAFRIPIFEAAGFEADDLLGALSQQAQEAKVDTVIVSGDTDAMQLVAPGVSLLTSRRGLADTVLYDEKMVRQRYGLEPAQVADLKGLAGDTSDNIPGVPGIGEKTAVRLLQQYGDVEGIYQHLSEVSPPKVREVLGRNEERARLGKRLATIVRDIPVSLDLASCRFQGYDRARVVQLFREWEFKSLLPKLPPARELSGSSRQLTFFAAPQGQEKPKVTVVEEAATDYRTITDPEDLAALAQELASAGSFVVDVETTGKDAMRAELVGISFSVRPGQAWYIPVGHTSLDGARQLPREGVLERLKPLLEGPDLAKVGHNAKYDLTVLARYGVQVRNLAFDSMIAAYLVNDKALGLKDLAFSRLGVEMQPISALLGTGSKQISMAQVPIAAASSYSCADADMTGRLRPLLDAELRQMGLWDLFTKVEMPLMPVLMKMEMQGVALDVPLLGQMSLWLGEQMLKVERDIYNAVGHQFNINSSQQLSGVLFGELRLTRHKRTKTGYSTDAGVLEDLKGAHPVIDLLLEYRQLAKLKSTYVDALPSLIHPETGRVHTSFNQAATATGRLSSSDPNLQNIPIRTELGRQVRRAFIAPHEGDHYRLVSADYSQIDLRILAHMSQDPNLLEAFATGQDIHAATASQVFGVQPGAVTGDMRRVAKTINFGVIYGISEFGLSQSTELSRKEAGEFISAYFRRHGRVKEYVEATKQQARELGYVETLLGRRRYIPEIDSPNLQVRSAAERMAVNMPIQGAASDIIKLAMIDIQAELEGGPWRTRMILQVHDELVFEAPVEEVEEVGALVREKMEGAMALSVPLKVDIKLGKNWGELE